jgi:hypothetical protein
MQLWHRGFEIWRLLNRLLVYEYLPPVCLERLNGWGFLSDSLDSLDFSVWAFDPLHQLSYQLQLLELAQPQVQAQPLVLVVRESLFAVVQVLVVPRALIALVFQS